MILRSFCRAKLHRLTVTDANIDYEGSITIDKRLLKSADLLPGEKVQVLNIDNGSRVETYIIEGNKKGEVCINGAAARLFAPGEIVIVIAYALIDNREVGKMESKVVYVDEKNNEIKKKGK